ncbi:MAG: sugar-binding domain-containing protein, partial [Actinomycetota bacterium]
MDSDRHTLLIRTAWLYHKHGLTQSEVAERLGVSRSTVSRALDEALRVGIVEVNVTEALPEATRLADALRERYPLKRAVVGIRLEDQDPSEAAAAGMGPAIEQLVSQGALTIAAGWGRTLAAATRSTRPRVTSGVTVVDAVGHATAGVIAPAVIVTDMLAAALSAR